MKKEKKWWRDFGVGPHLFNVLDGRVGETLIVFDTETTGLSPATNHIIQLSAIKCTIAEDRQLCGEKRLNIYINPGYPLNKKIIEITGITDAFLADKPSEDDAWPKIYDFFGDSPIVAGHNVSFDVSMLRGMYIRHGKTFLPTMLDTLKMAQELHLKEEASSFKLGALVTHFGLDYGLTFHDAADDTLAVLRLLRFFIEEYSVKKAEYDAKCVTLCNEDGETTVLPPPKIKTKIKSCWAWTGYKGMQRLYVRVWHENRVIWMNQRRPYNWGEKDEGSIEMFDMKDIENQVLKLYGCETLEELSKVRESRYAK